MITAMFALIAGPLLVYWLGSIATISHHPGDARHQTAQFALGLANGVFHAILLGALGLVIAAFARRRAFATAAVIGVYLITSAVAGALSGLPNNSGRFGQLFSPFTLLDGLRVWLLHGKVIDENAVPSAAYGIVSVLFVIAFVLVLLRRYQKIAT
jgi:hypothetical protein